MACRAKLSTTDLRQAERYTIKYSAAGERRGRGDLRVHLTNISARGCQIVAAPAPARGDRMTVRLPVVGWIEMFCIWTGNSHAGFQFERVIRQGDFAEMLDALRTEPGRSFARSVQDNEAV